MLSYHPEIAFINSFKGIIPWKSRLYTVCSPTWDIKYSEHTVLLYEVFCTNLCVFHWSKCLLLNYNNIVFPLLVLFSGRF